MSNNNGNLVLTRRGASRGKDGEGIRIGKDIHITIGQVRGDKVRLIINAPREIPVVRDELYIPEPEPEDAELMFCI